ncbi:MAG: winged helix-turn-helix domain-containing protein [Acidobacteriaceae bacterium]|nr:winged helix-turn-helix domain-containing protein [Acidobacteriaceae bacterium]
MGKIRFDKFEIDFEEREVRKSGIRLHLQRQPFRILELLLEKRGSLVTREELAQHLWPGLHVCFDRSLNTAMNALRQILGDSVRKPRFIETRAGLGYRFIAPVEVIGPAAGAVASAEESPARSGREHLKKYAANFDAYQDYLKGRYFLSRMHADSVLKAIAHFEAAIAQDANCAPAYAGLADSYCDLTLLGRAGQYSADAKRLADAAYRLDPGVTEVRLARGRSAMLFDCDWNTAQTEFIAAIEQCPDHADAHRLLGTLLSALAHHDAALRSSNRARVLDPLSLPVAADLARTLYMARDFEGAAEQCWKTLAMDATFAPAQYILGLAYQQLAMHEEAITELTNADNCFGHHEAAIGSLGHAYAMAGMPRQALESLHELEQLAGRKPVSPYWASLIYAGLGNRTSSLAGIERAHESRDPALLWIRVDPRLDPLRGETRFQRIIDEIGYPASAQVSAFA